MKMRSTSGGKARKKSTQAMRGQRTQGRRTPARRLSTSPPAKPSGTTIAERSSVLPSPARMMRQAWPMMSRLKKVAITSAPPGHARLEPAAEDHHRQEENQVGDRGEGKGRGVVAVRHRRGSHAEDLADGGHGTE